jgi:hypothetical protein
MLKNRGDNMCVEFNPKKQLRMNKHFGQFNLVSFKNYNWMLLNGLGRSRGKWS